jgi:alkane 1-monooxygenase
VSPADSWESASLLTDFTLLGLARHADHHAVASKPYQQLRRLEASPRLPRGYFGMVALVIFRNAEAQRLMTDELRRAGLRTH